MTMNQQVLLAARPHGEPKVSDFSIVETAVREPADGEIVVEHSWLSLDPYMRGRMNDARSYAKPQELGAVMIGGTVGKVIASKHDKHAVGDMVVGHGGWQQFAVQNGGAWMPIDTSRAPASAYLGAAGMPGITAWYGLYDIGQPKAGETLVVAAASGAVGSVVGQLAKLRGLRVVGIAGGADKCAYVTQELGFDLCLDHNAADLEAQLKAATPDGIDIYFENVGGPILDMVLKRLNPFARIPLCGLVSQYNATQPYGLKNFGALLTMRATLRGYIISEHFDRWPAALKDLGELVADGKLKYRESITEGLANAPGAFVGMLRGENFGKTLIKL
jgi:hypothetical protein